MQRETSATSNQNQRLGITATAANRADGTNDVLMSDVLRRHELQVWFLVDTPNHPCHAARLGGAGITRFARPVR